MAIRRMIAGRRARPYFGFVLFASFLASLPAARAQYPAAPQITKNGISVVLEDYASAPLSSPKKEGAYPAPIDYHDQLGRVNALRPEPPDAPQSANRFFAIGQNGILYILDKSAKEFIPYIDFGKTFPKLATNGFGLGIVSLAFDPAYAKNGKFYTIHTENPGAAGPAGPTNDSFPGLNLTGFKTTTAIDPPVGDVDCQSILMEWTDTNIKNSTFEGTAREVLRAGFNFSFHPMEDILFNPLARPGDADYGNLYISTGDGRSGETPGVTHPIPQRLDALPGKILRITPDIRLRPKDMLSSNGSYRIPSTGPDPNPFVAVRGARAEIFAYGFRNPQRITWDPTTNNLIANDIGNHSWEEVNIITKGGNYGWGQREGQEETFVGGPDNGKTGSQVSPSVPFPASDRLVVEGLERPVTPLYPAASYSHRDGDAIGSGFVYRGKLMPQLVGKYIFNDITTGRLFYTDLAEMAAARGMHNKQVEIHELQILYKSPYGDSSPGAVKRRMFDIVADAYSHKGGIPEQNMVLPGRPGSPTRLDIDGVPYGGGRADVRLARDSDGEIYVLSKSDGMIRKLVSAVASPSAAKIAAGR
jgi:hypothetical protein